MQKFKYVILGAGPSGLAFAHRLLEAGEKSFLVLEKETSAGGLCRSTEVDGGPLDVGGGHFLDVKRKDVLEFLFRFMPESEWVRHKRISTINLFDQEVDYPLEANVWQLPINRQIEYIEAAAHAGSATASPMPDAFKEWIHWKLGKAIARDYMLPYNEKIWSMDLNNLGTYWLYKLPDVSFREILQSCLERKPYGSIPAHGEFLYPKRFGYGEIWLRLGKALGDKLRLGEPIREVDVNGLIVNCEYQAEYIVNTVPWKAWSSAAAIPPDVQRAVDQLVSVPIDVDYHSENFDSRAHWIYFPQPELRHHRALLRHNFLGGSRGYWTESNANRPANAPVHTTFRNPYAYPVNTRSKPAALETISRWATANRIIPLGRWGTWEHMNSDVAVSLARSAAERMIGL